MIPLEELGWSTLHEELEAELVFDGPAVRCPVCTGELDQLAFVLDLEGVEPLHCDHCGAVLAA